MSLSSAGESPSVRNQREQTLGTVCDRREFLTGRSALRSLSALWQQEHPQVNRVRRFGSDTASYLVVYTRSAMACDFQLMLNGGQYPQAVQVASEALDLVEQLERQWTIFDERSEVSRINRDAYNQPVQVEERLFEILSYARQLSVATGGAFDITAAPLWRVWGFARRAGRMPQAEEIAEARARVGSQWWLCDEQERSVRFLQPGMEIHLGAIGKGYALDRVAHKLWTEGIQDFLLHAGQSSVLARGNRSGQTGWTVGVAHPLLAQRRLGTLRLVDAAIGTSSPAQQFFYFQGKRFGHVLDPRTGMPAEGLLSVTVRTPFAATADALATAFFVMGLDDARRFCHEYPQVGAVFVCPGSRHGEIHVETVGLTPDEFCPDPAWS